MAGNNTKMNISYTIKAIDRFTNIHKRLERQLDNLKRKTQSLPDKTVDVDVNTRQATRNLNRFGRQLDSLEVDLELLSDYELTPIFDGDQATKEISKIEKKLTRLRKEAELKLDIDADLSEKEIESLRDTIASVDRMLKRLNGSKVNVAVHAMTEKAEENIEDVARKLRLLPRVKTVIVNVVGDGRKQLQRITNFQRDLGDMGMNFAWGMLLATLPPIIMGITGALGAVASAATPIALGLGGLAAVGIPTLTKLVDKYGEVKDAREELANAETEEEIAEATEKLAKAMDGMSKSQLKAAEAMEEFGKFFEKFSSKFEPTILEGFTKTLDTTQKLLTILEPAIMGSAQAVNNLIDAFNRNLGAEDMKRFFAWVGETAGPNLEKLVGALGNFIAGFGNMMVAFDPLAQGFLNWFLQLSESFRAWAANLESNQAFQDFIAFCQEHGPMLIEFFGNLVGALWRLIDASAPFAMAVVEFVNKLLDLFNQTMDNSESFNKFIGGLWTFITVLTAVLAPIVILFTAFKTLLGPVVKWVAKLLGFDFKKGADGAGKATSKGLIPKIGSAIKKFGEFVAKIAGPVLKILGRFGTKLLGLGGPLGILIAIIIELGFIIWENWDAIWNWTKDIWGKVENFLSGVNLASIGADIMSGLLKGLKSVPIVGTFASIVDSGIKAAKRVLGIKSPSRVFMEIGHFTGEGLANGLEKMTPAVQKASLAMTGSVIPDVDAPTYRGVNVQSTPNYRASERVQGHPREANKDANGRKYTVEIPIMLNGREVAREIVDDITNEQELKKQTRSRFRG